MLYGIVDDNFILQTHYFSKGNYSRPLIYLDEGVAKRSLSGIYGSKSIMQVVPVVVLAKKPITDEDLEEVSE